MVIALRSVAWFGLLTFVPLWVVSNGGSEGEGNRELSLMLIAGAVGTLVLGPVADRIGLRRTLVVTQAALPLLIVCYVAVGGVVGTLALMLVGLCVVGTFGVTMVLSQLYLPAARGDGERSLGRSRHGARRRRGGRSSARSRTRSTSRRRSTSAPPLRRSAASSASSSRGRSPGRAQRGLPRPTV